MVQSRERPDRGGGVQQFFAHESASPLPRISHGTGVYLWDTAGRRYIDATSGPIVCNLGHGNPAVLEAMARQASQVCFAYPSCFESAANIALGDALARLCGTGLDRAYPVSGGSEAIELALRFARLRALAVGEHRRVRILSRTPSYHGSTLGALGITGDPVLEAQFGAMTVPSTKVPVPMPYRVPDGQSCEEHAEACAQQLETAIEKCGADTVLAFVIEPVGGISTGAACAPAAYYRRVRDICSRYGVLLIHDEVMSGAGRTGQFLAGHHWRAAAPDIVVLAKGLAAGYCPLGAVVVRDDLVETVVRQGGCSLAHTYGASPLACAAGAAVLSELERLDLITAADRTGALLRSMLAQIAREVEIVGDVRGVGLLNAIEFVTDPVTRRRFPAGFDPVARVAAIAREHGVMLYARRPNGGAFGDWVMIAPPLTISREELEELVWLMRRVLLEFRDEARRRGLLFG